MKIDQTTASEDHWIETQSATARRFLEETIGEESHSPLSAETLDKAFSAWLDDPSSTTLEANDVVNCVGVSFGILLIAAVPDLKWVIATDEHGTELAVYGLPGTGDVIVFPQNFVAKRCEAGTANFIACSIHKIQAEVVSIKAAYSKGSPKEASPPSLREP